MKIKNPIFQEEFQFSFNNKKCLRNLLISFLVLISFTYLAAPDFNNSYYFKNGIEPRSGSTVLLAAIFIFLIAIIRKDVQSLEDRALTNKKDWIKRTPFSPTKVLFSHILFMAGYSFILIALSLPLLLFSFSLSSANAAETGISLIYIFLFLIMVQLISLGLKYMTKNEGVFLALWIMIIIIFTLLFSLFPIISPIKTVFSIFSADTGLFAPIPFFGQKLPFYTIGVSIIPLLILITLIILKISFTVSKKGRF